VLYDDQLTGEFHNVPRSFFDREPDPSLGTVATEEALEELPHDVGGRYERYATDNDEVVNPRSLPGQRGGRFLATGNEHWPDGQIAEDTQNRIDQVDHRIGKIDDVSADLADRPSPDSVAGDEDADLALLTWGSQKGVVEEAVASLTESGVSVKSLAVSQMAPLRREEIAGFLEGVSDVIVVEMNATAQFKGLIQKEFGDYGDLLGSLLKYNGEPFEPAEIEEAVEIVRNGEGGATSSETTLELPRGVTA
jgi:pyruvate ferredoxin oxidoreductase alpha subunit